MTLPYDIARCSGTDHAACSDCRRREPGRAEWQTCIAPQIEHGRCDAYIPPVMQPVAWLVKDEGLYWTEEAAIRRADKFAEPLDVVPLYTTPPAPQSLRDLCAAAYQVVGVADGPVEMLDNLWAAAEGKPLPHDPGAGLPWSPPAPQPVADDDIDILTAKSRDDLMDFIYEYGTTSEGQQRFIRQIARAVEAEVLKRMGVGK